MKKKCYNIYEKYLDSHYKKLWDLINEHLIKSWNINEEYILNQYIYNLYRLKKYSFWDYIYLNNYDIKRPLIFQKCLDKSYEQCFPDTEIKTIEKKIEETLKIDRKKAFFFIHKEIPKNDDKKFNINILFDSLDIENFAFFKVNLQKFLKILSENRKSIFRTLFNEIFNEYNIENIVDFIKILNRLNKGELFEESPAIYLSFCNECLRYLNPVIENYIYDNKLFLITKHIEVYIKSKVRL